jgi:hypothetical protein
MRIAYLTLDEVNQHLASAFADERGVSLDVQARPENIRNREYDADLCDQDSFPLDERSANLAAVLGRLPNRPVAIHSYDISADQLQVLRRRGAIVARRLGAGMFARLITAVRAARRQHTVAQQKHTIRRKEMKTMNQVLSDRLRTVEVLENQTVGCMQVFGLRWNCANAIRYRTLDEALATESLDITETSEGGSVPLLRLLNRGDDPVFLMAGEQLVGEKQNRILNTSILAAAHRELTIPVSCVEAGRWQYSSRKFVSPGTMSHGKLRTMLSRQLHNSAARGTGPASNQGEVWKEVNRKLKSMGSCSLSNALQQTYHDFQTRLGAFIDGIRIPPECAGTAFAIAGRITGMDLFDNPATMKKLWPKLARAYALDAFEEKNAPAQPMTPDALRTWVQGLTKVPSHINKSPGLGHDVRLRSEKIVGSCLVVEQCPIHSEVFTLDANSA